MRLGGAEVQDPDQAMADAVKLAKEADVVIAVVGLNGDWETEGYDRTTLALPGRTDELVTKVAAANPKTVVVTQSVSRILSSLDYADRLECRRVLPSCSHGPTRCHLSYTLGISVTPLVPPLQTFSLEPVTLLESSR